MTSGRDAEQGGLDVEDRDAGASDPTVRIAGRQWLGSIDAAFLEMEDERRHMHVGGLFLLDPPQDGRRFTFAGFLDLVRSRLHLVPRYRQKVVTPPLQLGRPAWVDDPDFDLAYHVRHAALPAPGTIAQLTEYCGRILSRQLDRQRPLWELYVIEGLEDGRVALLGKTHHAMVDGIGGIDLATAMLDVAPDASEALAEPPPWDPEPTPTAGELAAEAIGRLLASPADLIEQVGRVARAPRAVAVRTLGVGLAAARVARTTLARPAPRSLLNRPPGRHRRVALQQLSLDEVKAVKNAFGTTVNDVVLAVVADATGRYLRHHGEDTDGVWLRALVPVSTRTEAERHHLGNRVVTVFVDLPMEELDPVARLRACHDAMREVRSSHAAVGAGFLLGLGELAPPTLHAMAARAAVGARLYNFLVTNVPGPQQPVYCLGARVRGAFPFTPLGATHGYGIGATSLDGMLSVGITADYDTLPDVEVVVGMLADALATLVAAAAVAPRDGQEDGR